LHEFYVIVMAAIIRFVKNWTLPVSMLLGAVVYLLFANVPILDGPSRLFAPILLGIMPWALFAMLFVTFCKVEIRDMAPDWWQFCLLAVQVLMTVAVVVIIRMADGSDSKYVLEGILASVICPTASAAAVITGKLGGSAASMTTYTLLSNFITALLVPFFFPLVEKGVDITFMEAFLAILTKVVLILIVPLFAAWGVRRWMPSFHAWVCRQKDLAFYIWGGSLSILMGQTIKNLIQANVSVSVEVLIAISAFVVCVLQFFLGKLIGGWFGVRINGGQALGQKNTIFAIWMSYTYLNPVASVAPGCYVVCQNIVNSWQLWTKRKYNKVY
jgi:BASS family bile acid:Na+ symporter